ncbi:hypothetical protein [Luteimonas terrae]|uniref:Uncharacterized protein n=1 Tax=Luteimonas terrae TaxID=1530191 RepID=A0ABU1XZD6_9GAMM|nr:hypothetical protein [Luteimonas terrae]MDR7193391.1 hypothetical protein [Luteimonas terrae]
MSLLEIAGIFGLLYLLATPALLRAARRREPLTPTQMAECADVHGQRLLAMAKTLRTTEGLNPAQRQQHDRMARDCERIAGAHLACINAITIDALERVGYDGAVHLGRYTPPARSPDSRARRGAGRVQA